MTPKLLLAIPLSIFLRRHLQFLPHECLLLQGFPKSYRFPKISISNAYKQCGNIVTILVIWKIAQNISTIFKCFLNGFIKANEDDA